MSEENNNQDGRKYVIAVVLSGIFGVVGIHHFYLRRWDVGFLDLGMFIGMIWLFAIDRPLEAFLLLFVDLVHTITVTYLLLVGKYKDGNGDYVMYPGQKN